MLKTETLKTVRVSREVTEALMVHHWPGNVRELKNCLNYMLAVSEGDHLTVDDLPETFKHSKKQQEPTDESVLTEEELFILKAIATFERQKEPCGREKLAAYSMGTPFGLTKYQMRHRLEQLEAMGYVTLGRGKVGVHLSEEGRVYLASKNTI